MPRLDYQRGRGSCHYALRHEYVEDAGVVAAATLMGIRHCYSDSEGHYEGYASLIAIAIAIGYAPPLPSDERQPRR